MKQFVFLVVFIFTYSFSFSQNMYIPSEQKFFKVQIKYVKIEITEDAMGKYTFINPAENDKGEYNGDGYFDNIYLDINDDGDISIYSESQMGEEEVPTKTVFTNTDLDKNGFTCKTREVLSFLYDANSKYSGKFAEIIYTSKQSKKKSSGFVFTKPNNNDLFFYEKIAR